jgi:ribosomal protein L11 methyltransferase
VPWLEARISVPRDDVAAVEEILDELGAIAVTLEDEGDQPVLEPGPGSTPLWPVVQLRGLFEAGAGRGRIAAALQTVPGVDRPERIRWREVGDRDWTRAWLDRFRPMRFGRRLWIVPGGMSAEPAPDNVEIRLDPGLAFGTGTHPTTALCLEWLDGHDLAGLQVVDYGCGSGVLGIAAARLGAAGVVCVDNDPQALEATADNAARNEVTTLIRCANPENFALSGADLVLANILAQPLIELAPVLTGCLRPGGALVLSGLLEEQRDEVAAAYAGSCRLSGSAGCDGWLRLDLQKR